MSSVKNIKVNCSQCGKEKLVSTVEIKRNEHFFCDRTCYGKWFGKKQIGNSNNQWNGGKKKSKCKWCGTEFERYPNAGNNGKLHRFCSEDCYQKWRKDQKQKCISVCVVCGYKKPSSPSRIKKGIDKTCSKECEAILKARTRVGEGNPNWRNGASFGKYCPKFNRPFKENVRKFFNQTCLICGHIWCEGEKRLSVHHVYYNKKSCCEQTEDGQYIHTLPKGAKVLVKGDPNKFATTCSSGCHGRTNSNRLKWALFFEELINTKYNGMSYTPVS